MMKHIPLNNVGLYVGQKVTLEGFVHKVRDQKSVQFIILRDRSGMVQAVIEKNEKNEHINQIVSNLTRESVVKIVGRVIGNPRVKLGGIEVLIEGIEILSKAASPLPFDLWNEKLLPSLDKRLDWRFLDLRRPKARLIFEIQTTAEAAMREFWLQQGFIEIHSPKLMGTASESGAELFTLEYFGRKAYLAQSPQFYKQMAMAAGFEKVFEIGPVFRANPSFTSRHDTEFTSIDVEVSWIDSHYDLMELEERWLQYVLTIIKEKHGAEIEDIFGAKVVIPSIPFPKIPMSEAQRILRSLGHTPPPNTKPGDIDPGGERLLSEYISREYGHEFVFVIDYPFSLRPFYHMRHDDNPELTKSFDLLWKGLEVTTGAQREHRYEVLRQQAIEGNINLENIRFYLDFFKYGCPPHGGYGFGLTRMLMILLNQPNVREVTYLYRGPNRLTP